MVDYHWLMGESWLGPRPYTQTARMLVQQPVVAIGVVGGAAGIIMLWYHTGGRGGAAVRRPRSASCARSAQQCGVVL